MQQIIDLSIDPYSKCQAHGEDSIQDLNEIIGHTSSITRSQYATPNLQGFQKSTPNHIQTMDENIVWVAKALASPLFLSLTHES
jgi:hypothetical protein